METQIKSEVNGLFLFNKPTGVSSAGFLNSIKRIFKITEPIGHGGTLDPFASGLLIVGIGRQYTRSLEHYLKGTEKTYEATIIIGAESTTYDRTGIISHIPPVKKITEDDIKNAINEIQNRNEQIPPPVSAKKIEGVPAYERARRGERFELKPQNVKLIEYKIKNIEEVESLTKLDIEMKVSSGFYIRSFAHDLGVLFGTDGYVEDLTRIGIGYFNLSEALELQELHDEIELVYRAKGDVQGVGFRDFAKSLADEIGITGHTRNMKEGGIEIIGQGSVNVLSEFLHKIKIGPKDAQIQQWQDYFRKCTTKKSGFEIT